MPLRDRVTKAAKEVVVLVVRTAVDVHWTALREARGYVIDHWTKHELVRRPSWWVANTLDWTAWLGIRVANCLDDKLTGRTTIDA